MADSLPPPPICEPIKPELMLRLLDDATSKNVPGWAFLRRYYELLLKRHDGSCVKALCMCLHARTPSRAGAKPSNLKSDAMLSMHVLQRRTV